MLNSAGCMALCVRMSLQGESSGLSVRMHFVFPPTCMLSFSSCSGFSLNIGVYSVYNSSRVMSTLAIYKMCNQYALQGAAGWAAAPSAERKLFKHAEDFRLIMNHGAGYPQSPATPALGITNHCAVPSMYHNPRWSLEHVHVWKPVPAVIIMGERANLATAENFPAWSHVCGVMDAHLLLQLLAQREKALQAPTCGIDQPLHNSNTQIMTSEGQTQSRPATCVGASFPDGRTLTAPHNHKGICTDCFQTIQVHDTAFEEHGRHCQTALTHSAQALLLNTGQSQPAVQQCPASHKIIHRGFMASHVAVIGKGCT